MAAIIWSKLNCPYCEQAKGLLTQKGIVFEERKLGEQYSTEDLLKVVPTAKTVPQIFMGETLVGGFKELKKYLEENNVN